MTKKDVTLWQSHAPVYIPRTAREPKEIVKYAQQFNRRDVKQIVLAFEAESYEMVSTYVLTKAMTALKKQIASLGMDFVGEMLNRPDISEYSNEDAITHYEAISLAQDLGMINHTQAMRLKQTLQTVMHFASLEGLEAEEEEMNVDEAVQCLRVSVQSVLGQPKIDVASQFVVFRQKLGNQTYKPDDLELETLKASPYFYQKTALSILLAMLKKSKSAQLEHAIGNINVIIPLLWDKLSKTERYQIGHTYSVLFSEGHKTATIGLKKALTKISGFDYVPETLRSNTFTKAAKDVLEAHEGLNNFYNEPTPMRVLATLGTTIPMPAFAKCLTATIAVRLGNQYGYSYAAQGYALKILKRLSENQWIYYLNECLPGDRLILEKIEWYPNPRKIWAELVKDFSLADLELKSIVVKRFIHASLKKEFTTVSNYALKLRRKVYG